MEATQQQSSMSPGVPNGHRLPGGLFLLLGGWHAFSFMRLVHAGDSRPGRTWYPLPGSCWWPRLPPLEPLLKFLGPGIGVLIEAGPWHPFTEASDPWHHMYEPATGRVIHPNVDLWAHATMYLGFMIVGLFELCGAANALGCTAPRAVRQHVQVWHREDAADSLPRAIEHAVFAVAWALVAASFLFHAYAQTGAWSAVHLILGLLWAVGAAAAVTEAGATPAGSARVAALVRICATLVVGGWFFVIAEMLEHKDVWDADPMAAHAVSVFAALLVMLVVLLWAAAAAIAACVARRACPAPSSSDRMSALCTDVVSNAPAATEMVHAEKDEERVGLWLAPCDAFREPAFVCECTEYT